MAAKKSLHQIITDLTAKMKPVVRDAFLAAIQDIVDTVILVDLIKAIEAGDYQKAFQTIGMSPAAMRPLVKALATVYETGGDATGATFPSIIPNGFARGVFRFDMTNPRAEDYLKTQAGQLITRIQEDARVNIRNVMQTNLSVGNNPRSTALDIVGRIDPTSGNRTGGIIGLAQNQELWVRNARADLQSGDYNNYLGRLRRDKRFDTVVIAARDGGVKLTPDQIDKLVSRYKDSLLQLRGESIARTETIQSLNRSQHEAIMQASDNGAVAKKDVKRIWDTAGDDRVRPMHVAMDGQEVSLDQPFTSPDGNFMMFPGDTSLGADAADTIQCRCRVKFKIDWLANLD